MKKMNMIKHYKVIATIFYLIGIGAIVLMQIGPKAWRHDFISGFGTGLIIVALVLTVIYYLKRKDEHFEDDLNASVNDERVIREKLEMKSTLSHVLIFLLIIGVTISAFYDFSFVIGGTIMLYVYIAAFIVLKIRLKFKRG